ncbi:hypothetical protein BB31_33820 [Amycolatopsis lurida NRRL 2430]|uniref:Uncharacterized protein n=1 Tax=Amycolatopsis lurida NRRL 2430 TaxID=1460371 RepID=A0A2P2FJL8_AMYLU|nr:hypothetical protein BB31_33820 [Amycolatopsis lurida NRRL 2430]
MARASAALLIRGQVQAADGVITLVADKLERLDLSMTTGPIAGLPMIGANHGWRCGVPELMTLSPGCWH